MLLLYIGIKILCKSQGLVAGCDLLSDISTSFGRVALLQSITKPQQRHDEDHGFKVIKATG